MLHYEFWKGFILEVTSLFTVGHRIHILIDSGVGKE